MKAARNTTVDEDLGKAGGALVLVKNAAVTEEFAKRYRTQPARKTKTAYEAYSSAYGAGQASGKSVAINPGVGAHSSRMLSK